ncbi:MAG TPA: hypothetical protein VMM84_16565, partial [Pyrinomonadaceae bacterium]|nr:hypothetical protein [Pyrinomonadaceae bacterium]
MRSISPSRLKQILEPANSKGIAFLFLFALILTGVSQAFAQRAESSSQNYYPNSGDDWERRTPQQVGMDPARLQ